MLGTILEGTGDVCPSVDGGTYPAVFPTCQSSSGSETRLDSSRWHSEEKSEDIISRLMLYFNNQKIE